MEITIDFITSLLVVAAIVVVLLSYLELWFSKKGSIFTTTFPKTKTMIAPADVGLVYPVYVYNMNTVKKTDFELEGVNINDYVDNVIPAHLGSKIVNPIKQMCQSLYNVPGSKMPLHNIYLGLSKSDEIMTNINPLVASETTEFRSLVHKDDASKLEIFMDDRIYFVR